MPHWKVLNYDKVVHLGFYVPLGFCVIASFPSKLWFRYGLMLIIVMLFGCSDEMHQHFVPGRSMDVYDWVADSIGGALGGILYIWWESKLLKNTRKKMTGVLETTT